MQKVKIEIIIKTDDDILLSSAGAVEYIFPYGFKKIYLRSSAKIIKIKSKFFAKSIKDK